MLVSLNSGMLVSVACIMYALLWRVSLLTRLVLQLVASVITSLLQLPLLPLCFCGPHQHFASC